MGPRTRTGLLHLQDVGGGTQAGNLNVMLDGVEACTAARPPHMSKHDRGCKGDRRVGQRFIALINS
eukprot:529801-Alexandrium_andersonii.AAC.1